MSDDSLKLTAYFAERDRSAGRFLGDAMLDVCERHSLLTSVLLRGVEGFGRHQVLQAERLLSLSDDLPMVMVAVDTRPRIQAALPDITGIAGHGLVTLERARLLSGVAEPVQPELEAGAKLTVYCGRYERGRRRPAFVEIVELVRSCGAASATVLLGVDGTAHGVRERARFVGRNARVPLMVIAVGSAAAIGDAVPLVTQVLEQPLMTLERVRVCKADGQVLEEPHRLPGPRDSGLATWVKLMVHADQDARHGGRPLYVELVRRLRAAHAGGATVLQGIWGYHGDREPQGDKLLSVRRHVPTTTVVIDQPERIEQWWAIVDELTDEAGVVTSELVPAFRAIGDWGEAGGLRLAGRNVRPDV